MSTQTLTRSGVGTLPVVNLLPPEIGEQRRLRKLQGGLAGCVLAAVGVVVLLVVAAGSQVSRAQQDLDATKAQGASLQTQTGKYADVPAVIAKVDAAKLQRSQAMAQEIRWSFYLNDLSLRIPSKVWLTNVVATQTTDAAPVAGAPTTTTTTYPAAGIGTVTFEGKAYGHNDVATWLQVLARERGWTQAYFTDSTDDKELTGPSGVPAKTFTSQVTITEDALSRRFDQKAGS
jgi:Tfp pilus assembly protein PilN